MKKWYIVQVRTGGEEVFKRDFLELSEKEGFSELVGDVVVPTRDSDENAPERVFPGYVMVQADMSPELSSVLKRTPGGYKVLGEVKSKELERVKEAETKVVVEEKDFVSGSMVKVVHGPFASFSGRIEEVDQENKKLRVLISIFGRETPVDVGFDQVESYG